MLTNLSTYLIKSPANAEIARHASRWR